MEYNPIAWALSALAITLVINLFYFGMFYFVIALLGRFMVTFIRPIYQVVVKNDWN